MITLDVSDLARICGGADAPAKVCTPGNPTGASQPTQFIERDHSGPSNNVMDKTNTLMSRGMSMLNDGRPSMPAQW